MEVLGRGYCERGWGTGQTVICSPPPAACSPGATLWPPPSTTTKAAYSTASLGPTQAWRVPACRPTQPSVPRRASVSTGGAAPAGPAVSACPPRPGLCRALCQEPDWGGGTGHQKSGLAQHPAGWVPSSWLGTAWGAEATLSPCGCVGSCLGGVGHDVTWGLGWGRQAFPL